MFVVPDFMAPAYVFVAAMASCRGDGVVASASPTPPAHEGTRTPRHTDHGQRRQAPPPMNAAPVRRVLDADARVEACRSDAVAVVS